MDKALAQKENTDSTPLRILLVHNRYKLRGGEDSVFEAERDMLIAGGHTVQVYEVTNDSIGENTSKIKLFLNTIWNKTSYKTILKIIAEFKPDVVHCHNTFPLISPSIYYACDKAGVPVVQTLHNYRLTCLNGYLFREQECALCERCLGKSPIRGIFKKCYRNSFSASATVAAMLMVHRFLGTYRKKVTKFIALTDFGKNIFSKFLPADKITVKSNPIPAILTAPAIKTKQVIFAGRLSPEKGADTLIKAWISLPNKYGFTLKIIGDGAEKEKLEKLASEDSSISFVGVLPKSKTIEQMSSSMLLISPSKCSETFGLAPVEAMSIGTPVLISDVVNLFPIVQDKISGRYFKAGSAEDLAEKLTELLS
ncbi:MAG: glycosyltransferase family 4 protein, partial [Kiritimatiellae bacterium]|nr:glycosyltransferase family 4 protein [Kiritimatiellia bacterium]